MPMSPYIPSAVTIHGTLKHYAETGMEGGYWAFIDDRFNHLPSNDRFCPKCGALWPEGTPEPDFQTLDQNRKEMATELGFKYVPPCMDGAHDWVLEFPQGKWSFDGFHFLKSHDHLVILAPQATHAVIWEGILSFPRKNMQCGREGIFLPVRRWLMWITTPGGAGSSTTIRQS